MRACSNGVWRIALVLGLLWAATAGAGEGPAVPGAPGAAAPLPNSDPTAAFWDDYELYNQGYSSMPSADGGTGRGESYHDEDALPPSLADRLLAECAGKPSGTPLNDTLACDIRVAGVNAAVPLLRGGIDGVYKPVACNDGRPMYLRQGGPPTEPRVLWWQAQKHHDWELANGTRPNKEDILMYGGDAFHLRPQHVQDWHVAAEFQPNNTHPEDYMPVSATVAPLCEPLDASSSSTSSSSGGSGTSDAGVAEVQPGDSNAEAAAGQGPWPTSTIGEEQDSSRGGAGGSGEQGFVATSSVRDDSSAGGDAGSQAAPEDWPSEDEELAGLDVPSGGGGAADAQWAERLDAAQAAAVHAKELKRPLLTDAEMEQQYSLVWQRAAAAAAQRQRSTNAVLGGVFMLAAVSIAVGLPMLYARRQRARAATGGANGEAGSLALTQAVRGRRKALRPDCDEP